MFADKILKLCENCFKVNGSRDVLCFCDFMVPKILLHNEIINKTRTKKDKGNSS